MDVKYNMEDVSHILHEFDAAIDEAREHWQGVTNQYRSLSGGGMEGEAYRSLMVRVNEWRGLFRRFAEHLEETKEVMKVGTVSAETVRTRSENLM